MTPDWIIHAVGLFSLLFVVFLTGIPVAFGFFAVSSFYLAFVLGRSDQLFWVALSPFTSLSTFSLAPVMFFVFLGALLFHSGAVDIALRAIEVWTPNIPARLSVVTSLTGAALASLTGSSIASATLLAKMLVPKMLERKYSPLLAIGPSFAAGGLALIVPPSGVIIILGAVTGISIGKLLIGGIIPGLILAASYCLFSVAAAWFVPSLAPADEAFVQIKWKERWQLGAAALPFGLIIFSVIGLLFLGVASPSEAAAFGTVSAFLLSVLYGRMSLKVFREAVFEAVQISVMLYTIVMGAKLFSQVIAFSGIAGGASEALTHSEMSPLAFFLTTQAVIFVLGLFMEINTIIFITMPIFMPIVQILGIDPIHFGIVSIISLELATYTPPFGLVLYASHSMLPDYITINTMFRIAIPWIILELAGIVLFLFVPEIVLWLPNLMLR